MKKIFLLLLLFVGIVSGNSDASPLFMAASGRSNVSPSIYYNFLTGTLPTPLTFTRASTGWYYNSAGILTQAANNVPRFDYNPLTLALNGLLIEQQSTNLVKNNSMVGAVVGTPGTLPTNWLIPFNNSGLNYQVYATGTDGGKPYIDFRVYGTASSGQFNLSFVGNTEVPATIGQTFTTALWIKLVGGSTTNLTAINLVPTENGSGGGYLTSSSVPISVTTTYSRTPVSYTTNNASCAYLQPQLVFTTLGGAIDITVRVAVPQVEQLPFSTSVILTSGSTVTRAADSLINTSIGGWYNQSQGTMFCESITEGTSGYPAAADFSDGTASNEIYISPVANGAGNATGVVRYGGVAASVSSGSITIGAISKGGLSYASGAFTESANGSTPASGTSSIPSAVTILTIGARSGGGTVYTGWLRSFQYYNTALTNAQLQQISGAL